MIPRCALDEWLERNNVGDASIVNRGMCENFAMDMLHYIPAGEIIGTDNMDGWDSPYPGHIWIFDGCLHFDSEALVGVVDWKELPIFKRFRERG